MKNKYKNIKNGKNDSIAEKRYFDSVLNPLLRSGKISHLRRLDKNKKGDYVVIQEGFEITKNGKNSKQRDMRYTPDFYFYNINSNFFPYLSDGKHVYLELKSEATVKEPAYNMRKKMFLKMLDVNSAFIEVIVYARKSNKIKVFYKE